MNIHSPDIAPDAPTREEAARALEVLRAWSAAAPAPERAALGVDAPGTELSRTYPEGFVADAAYRATLPDLQNGPVSLIRGARRRIQHVGISNFRMPLKVARREGGTVTLDTSVTGTVSLEAEKKGINMSRIMRSFYAAAEERAGLDAGETGSDADKREVGALEQELGISA